jgi:hypothetical protein
MKIKMKYTVKFRQFVAQPQTCSFGEDKEVCQDEGSHQDAGGGGHVTRDGSTGAVDIRDATKVQVQFVGVQEAHCGQGSFSVSYQHRGVLYFFNYSMKNF